MQSNLKLTRIQPEVLTVTVDRPERLNALTAEMFTQLVEVQRQIARDPSVRAVILTGAGRAFCAGLDLDLAAELPATPVADMLWLQESWASAVAGFAHLSVPVIAAIRGAAAGAGLSLALAADIRIAAPDARFNAAFVRIGLSGGDLGTSYLLPRLVGAGRAAEILLTGRFVDSDEALRIGLVTELVEGDRLLTRAAEIADTIVANSPTGIALTKHALRVNADAPSLESALAMENRNQVLTMQTTDMAEALAAFRDKRQPIFTGR